MVQEPGRSEKQAKRQSSFGRRDVNACQRIGALRSLPKAFRDSVASVLIPRCN
jgi:hypothetical protein